MKNRKFIHVLIYMLFFGIIFPVFGQAMEGQYHRSSEHHEKIKSMKIAFLTERLSLTPVEAERFWPVYNQFHKEQDELIDRHSHEYIKDKSVSELTEEEAKIVAESEIKRLEELALLKREYHEKYLEILTVRKVAILYEAERDFNRRLFREMRRGNRDRNGRR